MCQALGEVAPTLSGQDWEAGGPFPLLLSDWPSHLSPAHRCSTGHSHPPGAPIAQPGTQNLLEMGEGGDWDGWGLPPGPSP